MSLSRRSRGASIVALGSLALVLTGGPASAAVSLPDSDSSTALQREAEQAAQDLVARAQQALEPVAAPAPAAPRAQPAPAPSAPVPAVPSKIGPTKTRSTGSTPVDAVTGVVGALVTVVLDQLDAKPAPLPAPEAEGAVSGQGTSGVPVSGTAAVAAPAPRLSTAVTAANATTDAGAVGRGGGAIRGLGEFARDMAGIRAADVRTLDSLAAELSPELALSELLPQIAPGDSFLPTSRSQDGPASLPILLVVVAAAAVAISAAANGNEIRRRR